MEIRIAQSQCESYEMHGDGYYFNVAIHLYPDAPHTGRMTVSGEFNGSYYWGACGEDFKQFLRQLNMDYFYGKMISRDYREVDGDKVIPFLRRELIAARKESKMFDVISKKDARDLWDSLDDMDVNSSKDCIYQWLYDHEWGSFYCDGGPSLPTKVPYSLNVFWNEFRPALFAHWDKQAAPQEGGA